jgi:hypothetical protein
MNPTTLVKTKRSNAYDGKELAMGRAIAVAPSARAIKARLVEERMIYRRS